jgi:hypothetical protein
LSPCPLWDWSTTLQRVGSRVLNHLDRLTGSRGHAAAVNTVRDNVTTVTIQSLPDGPAASQRFRIIKTCLNAQVQTPGLPHIFPVGSFPFPLLHSCTVECKTDPMFDTFGKIAM